jgi:selenocysteine lyase/cysteine desulfurase
MTLDLARPRGTGFMYVRRELGGRLEPPLLDLHAAEWLHGGDEHRIRPDALRRERIHVSACATPSH